MLKIKDNVDLKELEKYGFKFNNRMNEYGYEENGEYVCVSEDRYIYCELRSYRITGAIIEDPLPILYDIIKDGLVEKVE